MQQRQYAINFLNQDEQRTDLLNRFSRELMNHNLHRSHFETFLFSVTGIAIQAKNCLAFDRRFMQRIYDANKIHSSAIYELEKLSITPNLKSQILSELESCKTYLDDSGYSPLSHPINHLGTAARAA